MKKALLALLIALTILFASACAPKAPYIDYIESMKLSQDEQALMNLVGSASSTGLYDFVANDQFKSVKVALDIYQFGKLIDIKPCGAFGLFSPDGKIAVLPDAENKSEFQVRITDGNGIAGFILSADQNISDLYNMDLSGMPERTAIANGEKYTLYTRVFSKTSSIAITADMSKTPEGMKDFEYVFIIRCEFSTESVNA